MDAELKAKWVRALRSGEYKQGAGKLRRDDTYCCLGVLCVVADIKITESGQTTEVGGVPVEYMPLRQAVAAEIRPLWEMNDEGKSFSEIADYIEANL